MEEENNKNTIPESTEETSTRPLSKIEQMEKALEEMNKKYGLKGIKGKPQNCTIMFVKR